MVSYSSVLIDFQPSLSSSSGATNIDPSVTLSSSLQTKRELRPVDPSLWFRAPSSLFFLGWVKLKVD